MKRHCWKFEFLGLDTIKSKILSLSQDFTHFIYLDSNHQNDTFRKYNWLAAWKAIAILDSNHNSFEKLQNFHNQHNDWCFGHLSFNLKNEVENLHSQLNDDFQYPNLSFFVPETVVYENEKGVFCESYSYANEQEFIKIKGNTSFERKTENINFELRTNKVQYLKNVERLKRELKYGNIYETNYCIEFSATAKINPTVFFNKLNPIHQAPFSSFYKHQNNFLLSFSPERFLQKTRNQLISQPIKGTAPRSKNKHKDQKLASALRNSQKEQSENVMIVDLVRNDLNRTAIAGSVKVKELFGIYSFKAVHQMISTIESQIKPQFQLQEILSTTFPMGSMTGAPKISALKLIDEIEDFNRGIYSGSVGYINPKGDFDFNVVIRSLIYNSQSKQSSVRVGSAITIKCDAEKEFAECLLKADKLINKVFLTDDSGEST